MNLTDPPIDEEFLHVLAEALCTANSGHYVQGDDYRVFAASVIQELAAAGLTIILSADEKERA